jgi:uncharacterized protein (DUF1778 family)
MAIRSPKKEVTINIRAHAALVDLIGRAAAIEGKTISEFLRASSMAEAQKVFEKPRPWGSPCPVCGHVD